jgi:hypothetical protein
MADNDEVKNWSNNIADFAVDALVDNGLIKEEDFQTAAAIVAEEVLVRLLLSDYPPPLSEINTKKN